jgi:hypothetical protein
MDMVTDIPGTAGTRGTPGTTATHIRHIITAHTDTRAARTSMRELTGPLTSEGPPRDRVAARVELELVQTVSDKGRIPISDQGRAWEDPRKPTIGLGMETAAGIIALE